MTMGDNPSVSSGIPIAISWEASAHQSISLEEYEKSRDLRRYRAEMKLPRMMRDDIARDSGCSRMEMKECQKTCTRIQEQRKKSSADVDYASLLRKVFCHMKSAKHGEFQSYDLSDVQPVGE
eukprot:CAMPEP_0168754048 /NCGR_PEP_ID=MMETSP0724-20121128/19291_1 /TAXON_ID=265536 /ORGANISM="Amphiprora sp., Strain CCMP467" /LENGTH=121 /DNA_ID=CAMNT_0008802497 /DNA_START=379 /DNA_END=744 /DNA_ORIENTATION=+